MDLIIPKFNVIGDATPEDIAIGKKASVIVGGLPKVVTGTNEGGGGIINSSPINITDNSNPSTTGDFDTQIFNVPSGTKKLWFECKTPGYTLSSTVKGLTTLNFIKPDNTTANALGLYVKHSDNSVSVIIQNIANARMILNPLYFAIDINLKTVNVISHNPWNNSLNIYNYSYPTKDFNNIRIIARASINIANMSEKEIKINGTIFTLE